MEKLVLLDLDGLGVIGVAPLEDPEALTVVPAPETPGALVWEVLELLGEAEGVTEEVSLAALLQEAGKAARTLREEERKRIKEARRLLRLAKRALEEKEERMRKARVYLSVRGKWENGQFTGMIETAPEGTLDVVFSPVTAGSYEELAAKVAQEVGNRVAITSDQVLARYLKARFGVEVEVVTRDHPYQHTIKRGEKKGQVIYGRTYPEGFIRFRSAVGQAKAAAAQAQRKAAGL